MEYDFIIDYWYYIIILFLVFYFYIRFKIKKNKYSQTSEYGKCESPIEEMLFKTLVQRGYNVHTQVPCGKYRIDIAVFEGRKKVAIECDGAAFHSSDEQIRHDNKKDRFLRKNKWKVLRFTGSEIYNDREWCVDMIQNCINPQNKVR